MNRKRLVASLGTLRLLSCSLALFYEHLVLGVQVRLRQFCILYHLLGLALPTVASELFIDPMFDVEIQEDIVFGSGSIGNPPSGEIPLALDLYTPVGAEFSKPGMLLLYGGGFQLRSLDQMRPLAESFASRGWSVGTMDYRIVPDDPTIEPGPLGEAAAESDPLIRAAHAAFNDAAKALDWMKSNAEELNINPGQIVVGGFSSGAIVGLTEGYRNNSVAAIVSYAGGAIGLEHLIDEGDPPAVLIHGTADTVVPFSLAEAVVARAENVGVLTAFMPIEGAGHEGFFNDPVHGPATFAFVNSFLYEQLELSALVPDQSMLDFNNDSDVDVRDIDALVEEIVDGTNKTIFDLTGDGTVDKIDLTQWLSGAATHNGFGQEAYLAGDSDLDGKVDAMDLNSLALNWRQDSALWSTGDFNADGMVNAADLNGLALNWRSELMAASANAPVPEPSAFFLSFAGLAVICRRFRSGCRRQASLYLIKQSMLASKVLRAPELDRAIVVAGHECLSIRRKCHRQHASTSC